MERIGMTHDPSRDFDHPNLPDWPRSGMSHAIGGPRRLERGSRLLAAGHLYVALPKPRTGVKMKLSSDEADREPAALPEALGEVDVRR